MELNHMNDANTKGLAKTVVDDCILMPNTADCRRPLSFVIIDAIISLVL